MVPLPQRIEEWAKKNNVKIVSAEKRRFFTGPFMWRKSSGGPVYRIAVRTPKDEVGEGWLCLQSFFGKESEEVRWIRKPAHILEPSPDVTIGSFTKWAFGVFLALVLIVWGFASLASGRLVIPSFLLRRRDVAAVVEGTPALLFAVTMISFGVFAHLHIFWGTNPYRHTSVPAGVFGFIGVACLILGLGFYIFEFVVGRLA